MANLCHFPPPFIALHFLSSCEQEPFVHSGNLDALHCGAARLLRSILVQTPAVLQGAFCFGKFAMPLSGLVDLLHDLATSSGSKASKHALRRQAFHLLSQIHALLSATDVTPARALAPKIKDAALAIVMKFEARNLAILPLVADVLIVLCDRVDSRQLRPAILALAEPLSRWRKPSNDVLA